MGREISQFFVDNLGQGYQLVIIGAMGVVILTAMSMALRRIWGETNYRRPRHHRPAWR
jgi:hypothetical protein